MRNCAQAPVPHLPLAPGPLPPQGLAGFSATSIGPVEGAASAEEQQHSLPESVARTCTRPLATSQTAPQASTGPCEPVRAVQTRVHASPRRGRAQSHLGAAPPLLITRWDSYTYIP